MADETKRMELTDGELEQIAGGEGDAKMNVHYCPYCNLKHLLKKQEYFTTDRELAAEAARLWRGYCGIQRRYFAEVELKSGGLRYYADNDTIIPTTGA